MSSLSFTVFADVYIRYLAQKENGKLKKHWIRNFAMPPAMSGNGKWAKNK